MKTARKLGFSIAVAAAFAVPSVMASTAVSVGDKMTFADGPGAAPGGAFNITDHGQTLNLGVNLTSFLTFCIEYNETMRYSTAQNTYWFKVDSISTAAKNGGVGVGVGGVSGSSDPLDNRTAFLYTNYLSAGHGGLGAVNGWSTANGVDRGTAMQQAIWLIENEIASTNNALALSLVNFSAGKLSNTGHVKVLNLVSLDSQGRFTGRAQDQLYLEPVPLPAAGLLMMSALGLGGLVTRRRKNAKQ